MSIDYRYFRVTDGPVKTACDEWLATRTAQRCALQDVMREFGATGVLHQRGIVGMRFDGSATPPAGWRRMPGHPNVWRPAGGSKAMRAIRQRFAGYQLVDWDNFHMRVTNGDPFAFVLNRTRYTVAFERIGEATILRVPRLPARPPDNLCPPGWQPSGPGLEELKTSEYWLLKEACATTPEED